ncbi:MAG: SGNH/GDSL hydrolase family protein [Ignavibacteria bacterium]|nr:SGNH/GDSL hydrolase family protein [Ignavibacteria bacterium]
MKGKFFIPFAAAFLILTPLFSFIEYNYSSLRGSIIENSPVVSSDETVVKTENKIDTAEHTILITGDSMADGIKMFLTNYCKYNGHKLVGNGLISSTTGVWSQKKKLKSFIEKYKPTYIIIALGSNELFSRDLEKREQYVKDIMEQTEGIKYIWIGPPNWKEDRGFNDMLKKVLGEKKFFASKEIFLKDPLLNKRSSDKRHPNMEGYRIWMDNIAEWVMKKSDYPIKLNKPVQ